MAADSCLLHIDGFEGQLSSFTKTTLTKFIESRKKWLFTDKQKIDRGFIQHEKRKAKVDEECSSETQSSDQPAKSKRIRLTAQLELVGGGCLY